jgi:outer membrane lipoprotein-sorting protein
MTVLEGASARYDRISTLCADFEQSLSVPLLKQEQTGRGRLCQSRPDRFAMRFTEPEGDVVVVDGTYVWVYYKSQDPKTVLRFPVGAAPGRFDLYGEFLQEPAEKYTATLDGREAVEGHDAYRIRLVPRTSASFKAAVVWIDVDDRLLRKVRVEEENESVRTVTLSNMDPAAQAPSGWFTFTPPPGAQVISR